MSCTSCGIVETYVDPSKEESCVKNASSKCLYTAQGNFLCEKQTQNGEMIAWASYTQKGVAKSASPISMEYQQLS